jgi:hypothetical protein
MAPPRSLFYEWNKEFLETGKKRPADTTRETTADEVTVAGKGNQKIRIGGRPGASV